MAVAAIGPLPTSNGSKPFSMCRNYSPGGALWRLFPVVRPEYLGAIRANFALLRSCKESPPPLLFFFAGPYSLLHVKTALTVAILQTYDCAVLRWPFEELRPKGRAAPKSPQTTKPIDMDWGGRWAFFCARSNSGRTHRRVKPDFRQSFRNWDG